MASPVIADPFHRMKYMERHESGLRKIVRETEKPPGYTAAYNPKIFSTATDFRVILKNVNYQLSQKNLVNDQVSEQDKSPDIPHTVLNLCIHLIAHGSEGAQITHAHSIMGTANDKSYDATHDNLSQIRRKECVELFKRNDVHLIVKVSVICTGDNEQFLVIAGQLAVRRLTEITGVRFLSVHQQYGGADLAAVLLDRHIQERQRGCHVPTAVGV